MEKKKGKIGLGITFLEQYVTSCSGAPNNLEFKYSFDEFHCTKSNPQPLFSMRIYLRFAYIKY